MFFQEKLVALSQYQRKLRKAMGLTLKKQLMKNFNFQTT